MKQYITDDQLFELENIFTTKEDYNEFWMYDLEKYGIDVDNVSYGDISEQFTVGKMIEILMKLEYKPLIDTSSTSCDITIFKDGFSKEFDSLELCDALWESIKWVLKTTIYKE